ncbi:hypothetical protein [Hydrogenothermus marinus]|uniref:Uncharacterized protein n=1 Tax=Hydrogenothermus marinus TaxID=133270 RepID=A0A3M0BFG0_9AQUI|nr:hypothetical protein [Hydrogenothermus marinus]RMA96153.1 hypothetical protein CLV39_1167 [Hydrogenothermus marinus]
MSLKKLLALFLAIIAISVYNPAVAEEDDEDNEIDLTSAVITAESCAKEAEETGEFSVLSSCPPHKAFEGIPADKIYTAAPKVVVFDVTEGEYYYVKPTKDGVTYSELLEGFGGTLDGSGVIVGEKNGISIVKFEEVDITPKPKPGFFKGCL